MTTSPSPKPARSGAGLQSGLRPADPLRFALEKQLAQAKFAVARSPARRGLARWVGEPIRTGGVIMMAKNNALIKANEQLGNVDTSQMEQNWNAMITIPPDPALTLSVLRDGRASAFWEFTCHGVDGHVSFNTGTYRIAHVTIRAGTNAKLVNYWFQIASNGNVHDAPTRVFVQKDTAKVLSALPSPYAAPIRTLLTNLYLGAV